MGHMRRELEGREARVAELEGLIRSLREACAAADAQLAASRQRVRELEVGWVGFWNGVHEASTKHRCIAPI